MTRRRSAAVILVVGLLVPSVWLGAIWTWWRDDPAPETRSQGRNAIWLAHRWVGEVHDDADYQRLAEDLRAGDMSDALFHAGPLAADGSLPADRYEHAGDLLRAMERHAPDLRAQAYLGQVEQRGGGPLDLGDLAVRERIAEAAERLVTLGFDGVHYDIEPIHAGDEAFLDLLQRTRALLAPHDAVLSVAVEEMVPPAAARWPFQVLSERREVPFGTPAWYASLAGEVDQLMVMTYGTPYQVDFLFGRYVAWQTEQTLRAVDGRADVFIGVPTEDHPLRPGEHICSGLRGVRKGMEEVSRGARGRAGVAVFAAWTTTEQEWAAYRQVWVDGANGGVTGCSGQPPTPRDGLG